MSMELMAELERKMIDVSALLTVIRFADADLIEEREQLLRLAADLADDTREKITAAMIAQTMQSAAQSPAAVPIAS